MGLPEVTTAVVQVAHAVDDPATAAGAWERRWGVGPFVVSEHIELREATVGGEPGRLDHSSAYARWGNVMVELICVHAAEPSGAAAAVSTAAAGVHHVASFTDDLDAAATALAARGFAEVVRAATPGGVDFAWFDTRAELGHLLELYEPHPRLLAFYAQLGVPVA